MKIIKINKCSECPYCEKLFPYKEWSDHICNYFEPMQMIEDTEKILDICELENGEEK